MGANGGTNGTNGGSNGKPPVASSLVVHDAAQTQQRATRDEIASYLNAEIKRGHVIRVDLVQASTFGTEESVRAFDCGDATPANDLAAEVYAAAQHDTANTPGATVGFYKLFVHREKDFASTGFFRFQTGPVARQTGMARSPTMGLHEQGLELCEERILDLSKIQAEVVEQIRQGRQLDLGTIKALNDGWKDLAREKTDSLSTTCAIQADLIAQLMSQLRDLGAQQIEMMQIRNELLDTKQERDLEKMREEKRIERGDKLFDKFFPVLLKKLASKFGADVADEAAAGAGAATTAKKAEEGGPVPDFSPRQARALGRFLQSLTQADFVGIYQLLSPEKQALFEEVGASFQEEGKAT